MASSEKQPGPVAAKEGDPQPPGKPMTMMQKVMEKGAQMVQSMKPLQQITQRACTFALYAHDLTRQIKTHHYIARLNRHFLQSAVYDSDQSNAHLIGDKLPLGAPALMMLPQAETSIALVLKLYSRSARVLGIV